MMFQHIKKYLEHKGINNLTKSSKKEVEEINRKFPWIPEDYLVFIENVGSGNIDDRIDLKGYLYNFFDLGLEDVYEVPNNICFFGDNFSGDFIGFDSNSSKEEVIEFWHDSQEIYYTGKTFKQYIENMFLE